MYNDANYFNWLTLKNVTEWSQVSKTISQNNVQIEKNKCFDQLQNEKTFLEEKNKDVDFMWMLAQKKKNLFYIIE